MKNTAFLFPGQGSQYPGMGSRLCAQSKVAVLLFEEVSDILGYNLKKICDESSKEKLANTLVAQIAVFTVNVAFYESYKDRLTRPHFMAGHSLGEFSALVCAGALTFHDAVSIIEQRARLMNEAVEQGTGTMSAINGLQSQSVDEVCDQISSKENIVSVAAFNTPLQTVVSGHKVAVERVESECTKLGAEVVRLKVSAPFHSPLMKQAGIELNKVLSQYVYSEPVCNVLSNVTGRPYESAADIVRNLTLQMTQPIRWRHTMEYLIKRDTYFFAELGPGKTLRNLLRNVQGIAAYAMDDEKDVDLLRHCIAENIDSIPTIVTKSLAIAASIKNRNANEEEYQKGVVEPFRALKLIQANLELKKEMPDGDEITSAVEILWRIMKTKKVDKQEALKRFEQLFTETGSTHLMPAYREFLN